MKTLEQIAAALQGYDPQALPAHVVNAFLAEWVPAPKRTETTPLVQALGLGTAWVVLQVLAGAALAGPDMRIAIAAHIGGFIAGLALARPLARP